MFFIFRLFLIAVMAGLWRLGGWDKAKWSGYRDVLVPVVLGIYYIFSIHFIVGILVAGFAQTIRIGYGAYDPVNDPKPSWLAKITKDKEGWIIRMIYGGITSFAIGLVPTIYSAFFVTGGNPAIAFIKFFAYIGMNVGIEFVCNKLKANVWVTELSNGVGRGSILLWVK